MTQSVLTCFLSGVLYAAFFKFAPSVSPYILMFSILLPVLLFIPAFILGVFGVLCAALPIIVGLFINNSAQIYPFFLLTLFPCIIAGYIFFDQKVKKPMGVQNIVELISFGMIIFFSVSLCIPKTYLMIEGFITRLNLIVDQLSKIAHEKTTVEQLLFMAPLAYIFINITCAQIALRIVKKINPKFIGLSDDYTYRPWLDIPVLFFMTLQSLSEILNVSPAFKLAVNGLLLLSLWPPLFLGIQVFKTIGSYYGFSEKIIKITMGVLFFLVHPLLFIVILGLMESSASISQRFHKKQF
ncbi:MAG: hypothetical protein HEEMFOPI_01343 [Holosporales bacterium]